MTTIDVDEKARNLGVNFDDLRSAVSIANDIYWEHQDDEEHFGEYAERMTEGELLAIIRWNNLHKCWPQYFTWDGAVE